MTLLVSSKELLNYWKSFELHVQENYQLNQYFGDTEEQAFEGFEQVLGGEGTETGGTLSTEYLGPQEALHVFFGSKMTEHAPKCPRGPPPPILALQPLLRKSNICQKIELYKYILVPLYIWLHKNKP